MQIISVEPNSPLCNGLTSKDTVQVQIAMLNGKQIGYIRIDQHENDFFIEQFHIDKPYRNNGYGTQLLESCLEDFDYIKIMVNLNQHQLAYMCKKQGFHTIQTSGTIQIMAK